jgi:hypothetical protein
VRTSRSGASPSGRTRSRRAEYEQGGHFAAMETPDLLVQDIRSFFRTVR